MALQKIIEKPNLTIGVWNIEEINEDVNTTSTQKEQISISNSALKKRKREQLFTQLLLKKMRPNTNLYYNSFGAPKINNTENISISHTDEKVAIIISNDKVGLDIEKISDRILDLSQRFINEDLYSKLCKNKATLIWSAKEAIYKWHEKGGVNFRKDIIIEDFNINEYGSLNAYFKNNKLILNYKKINNHYLVYICH